MRKSAKRKLLIIIAVFLGIAVIAFLAFHIVNSNKEKEKDKPKGDIEQVEEEKPEKVMTPEEAADAQEAMATDEDMYKELASHAYTGTIEYRDLYFIFKPLDFTDNSSGYEYECVVTDKDDDPYSYQSLYVVDINDHLFSISYVEGPYENILDCSYKNGVLTINGVEMTPIELSEIPDYVYGYGPKE